MEYEDKNESKMTNKNNSTNLLINFYLLYLISFINEFY